MKQKTLLIIDDEAANLAVLKSILGDTYKLYFLKSGADTLRMTKKHKPDLILLDIVMPGMDGFEVLSMLKKDKETERVPVMFISGLNDAKKEEQGLKLGAIDFISKPFSPSIVLERIKIHLSLVRASALEESYMEAVGMLCEAGHHNDTDTGLHVWRMASYCRHIAEKRGWDAELSEMFFYAASLHDTGKIAIPTQILQKPGKLTEQEFEIMKTHTTSGMSILGRSMNPMFSMAADIAGCHHEKFDGTGYPYGLKGKMIFEPVRIVALCDVFDALTTKRPYKDAWPVEEAIAFLESQRGKHFDPEILDVFLDNIDEIIEIKEEWFAKEGLQEKQAAPVLKVVSN